MPGVQRVCQRKGLDTGNIMFASAVPEPRSWHGGRRHADSSRPTGMVLGLTRSHVGLKFGVLVKTATLRGAQVQSKYLASVNSAGDVPQNRDQQQSITHTASLKLSLTLRPGPPAFTSTSGAQRVPNTSSGTTSKACVPSGNSVVNQTCSSPMEVVQQQAESGNGSTYARRYLARPHSFGHSSPRPAHQERSEAMDLDVTPLRLQKTGGSRQASPAPACVPRLNLSSLLGSSSSSTAQPPAETALQDGGTSGRYTSVLATAASMPGLAQGGQYSLTGAAHHYKSSARARMELVKPVSTASMAGLGALHAGQGSSSGSTSARRLSVPTASLAAAPNSARGPSPQAAMDRRELLRQYKAAKESKAAGPPLPRPPTQPKPLAAPANPGAMERAAATPLPDDTTDTALHSARAPSSVPLPAPLPTATVPPARTLIPSQTPSLSGTCRAGGPTEFTPGWPAPAAPSAAARGGGGRLSLGACPSYPAAAAAPLPTPVPAHAAEPSTGPSAPVPSTPAAPTAHAAAGPPAPDSLPQSRTESSSSWGSEQAAAAATAAPSVSHTSSDQGAQAGAGGGLPAYLQAAKSDQVPGVGPPACLPTPLPTPAGGWPGSSREGGEGGARGTLGPRPRLPRPSLDPHEPCTPASWNTPGWAATPLSALLPAPGTQAVQTSSQGSVAGGAQGHSHAAQGPRGGAYSGSQPDPGGGGGSSRGGAAAGGGPGDAERGRMGRLSLGAPLAERGGAGGLSSRHLSASLLITPRTAAAAAAGGGGGAASVGGSQGVDPRQEVRVLRLQELQWRVVNARMEAAMHARQQQADQALAAACLTVASLQRSTALAAALMARGAAVERAGAAAAGQQAALAVWTQMQGVPDSPSARLASVLQALQDCLTSIPLLGGATCGNASGGQASDLLQLEDVMYRGTAVLAELDFYLAPLIAACAPCPSPMDPPAPPAPTLPDKGSGSSSEGSSCAQVHPAGSTPMQWQAAAAAAGWGDRPGQEQQGQEGGAAPQGGGVPAAQLLASLVATVRQELELLHQVLRLVKEVREQQLLVASHTLHLVTMQRAGLA
ncbi:hypothetical protein QJQ45_015341 [Haematococcus lacustris]|nr:hypothetical protein QJQ45_015341 [Haematococcus lacustris]